MIIITDMSGLALAGLVNLLIILNYYIFRHTSSTWLPKVRDALFVGVAFISFVLIQIFLRIVIFQIWGPNAVIYHLMASIICLIYAIFFIFGAFFIAPTLKNFLSLTIALVLYIYFIYLDHSVLSFAWTDYVKLIIVGLIAIAVDIIEDIICKVSISAHNVLNKPIWDLSETITPRFLIGFAMVLWFVGQAEAMFRFEGYTMWDYIWDLIQQYILK